MNPRSLYVSLVLLIAAGAAAAQGKWQTFHPAADAFSIETPFPLTQRGGDGKDEGRKYQAGGGDTYLYVFSDPAREAHQAATIVEFVKSQGQVLSISRSQTSPLEFKDEFGYWHTIATVNNGSRIFIVQAVSADEASPVAKRFVSTFKAEPSYTASTDASPEPPPAEVREATLQLLPPDEGGPGTGSGSGSGIGSGLGSGTGFGTGSGSGIGSGGVRPPPPVGNHPLTILTKPKPAYTELGRLYEINGTVILRVPFLETGKVGVVSVVKGLPFGLTRQAVNAARRVTFEPQLKDGQPVSVTKQVEYNFNIY